MGKNKYTPTPSFENKKPSKRLYAQYRGPEGSEYDEKQFKELEEKGLLKLGELYVVDGVDMSSGCTSINLQGIRLGLNSIAFDFYQMEEGKLVEHDIYDDAELNPYIESDTESGI